MSTRTKVVLLDPEKIELLTDKLEKLAKEKRQIESEMSLLAKERRKLYLYVYDDSFDQEYTALVDKFIRDNNYKGKWPEKWRCERFFYLKEKDIWDIQGYGQGVYYGDVELRYKTLHTDLKGAVDW